MLYAFFGEGCHQLNFSSKGVIPFCRLGQKVKVNWKLTSIEKTSDGSYTLTYETQEGTKSVRAKSIVLTVPSYVASDILRPVSVS